MDAEELEEGQVVGKDNEDELEDGEIVDSDTDPGGEVTKVEEEEEEDDRGYMGRGPPLDSEESVYLLSSAESAKSRVSFARSLTYSLEEAAAFRGNSVSLKYPDLEEEVATGDAGSEARDHSLGAQEAMDSSGREEERLEDVEDMRVAMVKKRSAKVDSDTLLAAAEEGIGSKKRNEIDPSSKN